MHQNLFVAAARFAPWGGLLRRLPNLPFARGRAHNTPDTPAYTRPASTPPRVVRAAPTRYSTPPGATRQRPSLLRVIHIMEPGPAAAPAGRLLMSGRMADVCAELDRMVEREAAQLARS